MNSYRQCKKTIPFIRSFASFDGKTSNGKLKVDCWDNKKNGKVNPRDVFKSSRKKYFFDCDVCNHTFDSSLNNITCSKPNWCPHCTNKTETKLYNWFLQKKFSDNSPDYFKESKLKEIKLENVEREYSPKWCSTEYYPNGEKDKYQYRYDFLLTFKCTSRLDVKRTIEIIVELDGEQHFKQVSNWKKTPFENQIRDKYKEFKARQNLNLNLNERGCDDDYKKETKRKKEIKNINNKPLPVVRCLQVNVYNDENEWEKRLLQNIESKLLYFMST